ncbi:hypothetical protein [Parasedimentitalea huanghaiensis]|uniref:Uncharacterized protein n=1 Tax=Parasedimentitalea huanghaiensis TaxID=2682100 RepID=A0A6L6WLL8_9RHOB|nr:hypothetical protein [Zongyanglinia huanghaiensis]MVO18574.1 hypothetical protein [Zongyanglinia huanghaiensis]
MVAFWMESRIKLTELLQIVLRLMIKPNLFWIMVAVPSILMAAMSLYLVSPEMQARSDIETAPASVLLSTNLKEPEFVARTSLTAQIRQLSKCDDILSSILARAAGVQPVAKLAKACEDLANHVLRGTPTLSIAHLVRARGLQKTGFLQQAEESFLSAHLTGTNEGWLASRRLRFFFEIGLSDTLDVQHAAAKDALTVLQDENYHILLPRLYSDFPDFRDWLSTAVQDGEVRYLKRFVRLTKERLAMTVGVAE